MKGTGTLYLSRTQGPGDFISLIDGRAWLFEYGFYVAGQYYFLRETPETLDRVRPMAGGYGLLMIVLGVILVTLGSADVFRAVGFFLAIPGAVLLAWGSR
jgi:hypothetical protein